LKKGVILFTAFLWACKQKIVICLKKMQIEKPSLSSEQKSLAQEFSSMRSPHQDKGERAATDLDTLNLPNNETRELAQNQAQNLEINSAVNKPIVKEQNYIENFINNKMVSQVFPNIMNWLNIGGNIFSFLSNAFDVNDSIKKVASKLASFATKSFMISTSVINIVERSYAKNYFSALGFLNDILIAGSVAQKDTYLARGTASGTYNMANSLADSVGKKNFDSFEDHIKSVFKAYKQFFANLFSKNIVSNFKDHKKSMWAIFGGLGSNIGALAWMFGAKPELPTLLRDICGVMMDVEQLNPGHLKSGRKNFFWSGLTLAIGTISDLVMRFVSKEKQALLIPMTYIFDGLGRHLLRLDRNERELEKLKQELFNSNPESLNTKPELAAVVRADALEDSNRNSSRDIARELVA